MLKLFRKIRFNLMYEKRFSKYLLYAIGEILLVVIGILIALQVNDWNENRKEKQLEKVYISKLIEDMEADISTFENHKRNVELNVAFGKYILAVTNENEPITNKQEFVYKLQSIGRINFPLRSNNTFLDLQNTGNLKLFDSDSLLNALRAYYIPDNDFWKQNYVQRTTEGLLPIVTDALPFNIQEQILGLEIQLITEDGLFDHVKAEMEVTDEELEYILGKINLNEEFQFHLKNATRAHMLQIRYNTNVINSAKRIIRSLKQSQVDD